MKREPDAAARAPSLLDARATGGIYGGDGFTVQDRYLALSIPGWLRAETFEVFQSERSEDIDVWFGGVRDHHQVKSEYLTRGDVRSLVEDFMLRNTKLVAEQRIRRFVIASANLSEGIRGFVGKLLIFRKHHFGASDGDEREASLGTLREAASKLGLAEVFEYIVNHVVFEQKLVSVATDGSDTRVLLATRLLELLKIRDLEEGKALADALLAALSDDRTRAWSRKELVDLIERARQEHRQGPPRPAGDLILVRHATLKRVDRDPRPEDNAILFGERRAVLVDLDGVDRMVALNAVVLDELAHRLVAPDGAYVQALDRGGAQVLYYGFPHVPFAVLAGYVAQPHRQIALVEHDLDSGRFEWRPDEPTSSPIVTVTVHDAGAMARVRVSVSARVREDVCEAVLPLDAIGVDISIEAEEVGRGTVATEAQARVHAAALRRALDQCVNGNARITSIHLFAAVPVSVAFRIGQVLANTGLPRCYVYNFDATAVPQYRWRLDIHEAMRGAECAELLERGG
jgi:hypothetical protein